MKRIIAPEEVTKKIIDQTNAEKQRKTLDSFLPAFFDENFFISDSEIVATAHFGRKPHIDFYPTLPNATVITKHKDGRRKDTWERRYKPGVAIRLEKEKIDYIVYMENPAIEGKKYLNRLIKDKLGYY